MSASYYLVDKSLAAEQSAAGAPRSTLRMVRRLSWCNLKQENGLPSARRCLRRCWLRSLARVRLQHKD